jgi:hypothetical protein
MSKEKKSNKEVKKPKKQSDGTKKEKEKKNPNRHGDNSHRQPLRAV